MTGWVAKKKILEMPTRFIYNAVFVWFPSSGASLCDCCFWVFWSWKLDKVKQAPQEIQQHVVRFSMVASLEARLWLIYSISTVIYSSSYVLLLEHMLHYFGHVRTHVPLVWPRIWSWIHETEQINAYYFSPKTNRSHKKQSIQGNMAIATNAQWIYTLLSSQQTSTNLFTKPIDNLRFFLQNQWVISIILCSIMIKILAHSFRLDYTNAIK
jgi:hypothetical protein